MTIVKPVPWSRFAHTPPPRIAVAPKHIPTANTYDFMINVTYIETQTTNIYRLQAKYVHYKSVNLFSSCVLHK